LGITAVASALLAGTAWSGWLVVLIFLRIAAAKPPADADKRAPSSTAAGRFTAAIANRPRFCPLPASSRQRRRWHRLDHDLVGGVFAGSMLWWLILTALVAKSARLLGPPILAWINRVSAMVLIGFAVWSLTAPA
jgi:putative LysE/RhtB family amino acid efflux pump